MDSVFGEETSILIDNDDQVWVNVSSLLPCLILKAEEEDSIDEQAGFNLLITFLSELTVEAKRVFAERGDTLDK